MDFLLFDWGGLLIIAFFLFWLLVDDLRTRRVRAVAVCKYSEKINSLKDSLFKYMNFLLFDWGGLLMITVFFLFLLLVDDLRT